MSEDDEAVDAWVFPTELGWSSGGDSSWSWSWSSVVVVGELCEGW